ncbi:MAG TPA: 3D domain-containing protein [Polyangiaceae bacterium]|nr:3D domain-containing protein [Polyangiaceae bacterium]
MRRAAVPLALVTLAAQTAFGCHTGGSDWMAQPLDGEITAPPLPLPTAERPASPPPRRSTRAHVIGEAPPPAEPPLGASAPGAGPSLPISQTGKPKAQGLSGKVLGTFKNTYYDFPSEGDFEGEPISLMNPQCQAIAGVPRGFYESVCVQGSGTLKAGGTVSFAKRDCACAAECPRTGQRICFDLLDKAQFPWGRGAMGKPITPLVTVAVDSNLIPLGTPLYIPEYEGIARDPSGSAVHDGCFLAEDRGLKVQGQHVDIFTGHSDITRLWNRLVPSNKGVTVVLDSPRCKRAP